MNLKILVFLFAILFTGALNGQDFLDGSYTFSNKKESYITLTNGDELVGYIKDIDRKKGLIKAITIKDKNDKKIELKPEQIKHMYIAPSGFDNFNSATKKAYKATKWQDDQSAHASHMKQGYVFFETTEVMIKKEKLTLLLQLINPGFSNKIKVYFDPNAQETASFGVGGITVAGGDAKSYYFKKGDAVAFKMMKKNYDDEFENLYGDCPELKKEFGKNIHWSNVEEHVFFYSEKCK